MIRVFVKNVSMSQMGFAVLLEDGEGRILPIFIGPCEAQGIAMKLSGTYFPRPLTYDLFANVLEMIGAKVERVIVNDLRDSTFFARLIISTDDEVYDIDSRPSDAIALALRFNAPVFVEESIMEEASVNEEQIQIREEPEEESEDESLEDILQDDFEDEEEEETESFEDWEDFEETEKENQIEHLRRELEKAVREERYEDAAKIRDKIRKLLGEGGEEI